MDKFKTDIAKAFGNALREARKAAGLSQEALSLSSGIDRTFVSMLERGIRQPALSTIFSLAKPLGVAPGAILVRAEVLLGQATRV